MVMKEAKGDEGDVDFAKLVNIGDKVEGTFLEVKDSAKYEKVFTLGTDKNNVIVVGKTDLNPKMAEVPIGVFVSIELVSLVKIVGKNDMKIFKVLFEDGKKEGVKEELVDEATD